MFCEKCGAQIPEGAGFCQNCGAPAASPGGGVMSQGGYQQGQPVSGAAYQGGYQQGQPVSGAAYQGGYQQGQPVSGAAYQGGYQQGQPVSGASYQAGDGEAWRQHATAEENAVMQGQKVSPNVYLGRDGKYRWIYELKLAGNPSTRRLVQKIIGIILAVTGAFLFLIFVFSDGLESALPFLGIWLAIMVGVELVSFLIMPILSLFYRGSYWTIFEMDEKKITQIQMKKTFERTRALGLIFFLTDDNIPDMMTSIKMATKDRYESELDNVRTVKLDAKHDLIDVTGLFVLCPVYAQPEDYDFILNYILQHIPQKAADKFHKKYH